MNEKLIWEGSNSLISEYFEIFKVEKNIKNFSFLSDWKKYPFVLDYLKRLVMTSFDKENKKTILSLIAEVEVLLRLLDNLSLMKLDKAVDTLKDKTGLHRLYVLPRHVYYYGISEHDEIGVKKNISYESNGLEKEMIRRSVLFHEVGHKLLDIVNSDEVAYFDDMITHKYNSFWIVFLYRGFILLEEALAQNFSEFLTYNSIGEERPNIKKIYIKGLKFYSNFDVYAGYHYLVHLLGEKVYDEPDAVDIMVKRALDNKLLDDIFKKYKGREYELYWLFVNFGIIESFLYKSDELSFINNKHIKNAYKNSLVLLKN